MTGGWYDAGDHGKYVVNGGIATYQLLSSWERNKNQWADGILSIPERGNGVPDVLDEARWNLEFMVKMQVPDGKPFAGMVHPKVHDETLTGPPNLPHLDKKQRELQRPSTAATLNLAAVAARAPGSTRDTTRRSRRSCAPRRRRPTAPTSPAVGITRPGWRSPRTVSTGVRWPPSVRWTWPVTAPPAPTSTTRSTSTAAVRRIPRLHTARPAGRLGSGRPQLQPPGPAGRILAARLRPPLCYVDNIEAWSVNEITINWNSDLAWVAGFAAATKR